MLSESSVIEKDIVTLLVLVLMLVVVLVLMLVVMRSLSALDDFACA